MKHARKARIAAWLTPLLREDEGRMMDLDEAMGVESGEGTTQRALISLRVEVERLRVIEETAKRLARVSAREQIGIIARCILGEDT